MDSKNDDDLKCKIDNLTKQFEELKREMNEKYIKLLDNYENLKKEISTIKYKIDENKKKY